MKQSDTPDRDGAPKSRSDEGSKPWEQHPVRTLHACVETLASALKGYLPYPEELRDANVRRLEMLVKDTVERADACMTIIEHGQKQAAALSEQQDMVKNLRDAAHKLHAIGKPTLAGDCLLAATAIQIYEQSAER